MILESQLVLITPFEKEDVPMKKRIFLFFLVAFIGVAFLTLGSLKAEAAQIKLTFSIFFPPTHGQAIAAIDFGKEIEKRTDGKVQITAFPGGTLTKAPQCYDGVVKGISDMGNSCFAYTRGRFPVMAAVDLPMGYTSGTVATRVANEFAKSVNPKELQDVKVLYVHAHGPGLLHTKKPVRTLEELKGMKIRATGLSAKVVEALGGVPVAMPQGGTYEALKKGVVEGTFSPIEVLKGWKQGEVIKYTTECYSVGYTTAMFIVMNKAKWNALPADVKKVIDDLSNSWVLVHGKTWDLTDEEGRNFTKKLGNELISLSDAESAKWRSAVEPVIKGYASKTPNGADYVSTVRKLIKKYSK